MWEDARGSSEQEDGMFYVKKRGQFLFAVFSLNLGPQESSRKSTIALAPNRQWRSRIMRRGEGVGGRSCRECI